MAQGTLFNAADIQDVAAKHSGRPLSCISCGLYGDCKSPKIQPYGDFTKGIMNIGEAPGAQEDRAGQPWQGSTGRRLKKELASLGIDLFGDCINVNAVNCRPPSNRMPNDFEVACCRERIVRPAQLRYKPNTMILYGAAALQSVVGARMMKEQLGGIGKWRGRIIPDQKHKAWVCPTFHPSYIEREKDREEIHTIWRQDLERALATVGKPVPDYTYLADRVTLLFDEEDIISTLRRIMRGEEGDVVSFDYETTGLKPQAPGHHIVCASVATKVRGYAFMGPRTDRVKRTWSKFLQTQRLLKMAHNMKFEDIWSTVQLGTEVKSWYWDTMLHAHVFDNRPKTKGLKDQVYYHLGITGYDDAIAPYLKGVDGKDANSMNRIYEGIDRLGEAAVLTYCALDSIYCFKLHELQLEKQQEILNV